MPYKSSFSVALLLLFASLFFCLRRPLPKAGRFKIEQVVQWRTPTTRSRVNLHVDPMAARAGTRTVLPTADFPARVLKPSSDSESSTKVGSQCPWPSRSPPPPQVRNSARLGVKVSGMPRAHLKNQPLRLTSMLSRACQFRTSEKLQLWRPFTRKRIGLVKS